MGSETETNAEMSQPAMGGFGWRSLQMLAGVAILAALAGSMISVGFDVFLLIIGGPVLIGLVLLALLKRNRIGVIFLGVISLALFLLNAPFVVSALAHPENAADFIFPGWVIVALLIGIVASIGAFRAGKTPAPSGAARALTMVGTLAVVALAATGIIASALYKNEVAKAGDVWVLTNHSKFLPTRLGASSGTVAIYGRNKDNFAHTFTIDKLKLDIDLPGGKSRRKEFTAAPGSYDFYCKFHENMKGTLEVK